MPFSLSTSQIHKTKPRPSPSIKDDVAALPAALSRYSTKQRNELHPFRTRNRRTGLALDAELPEMHASSSVNPTGPQPAISRSTPGMAGRHKSGKPDHRYFTMGAAVSARSIRSHHGKQSYRDQPGSRRGRPHTISSAPAAIHKSPLSSGHQQLLPEPCGRTGSGPQRRSHSFTGRTGTRYVFRPVSGLGKGSRNHLGQ